MPDITSALDQLDALAAELAERGDVDLADKARSAATDLRAAMAVPELITPQEAATFLGIRSVPMVTRWAREKLLEGFNVGGQVKVTRESVERLLDSPIVARRQASERDLGDASDDGEGPVPASELPPVESAPWYRSAQVRA